MKDYPKTMPILRLAYIALFLIAIIAVYTLWGQVGGQGHLDLVPWYIKLALGGGASVAIVRAAASAVKSEHGWNGQTVKWTGLALAVLFLCGMASFYAHSYLEDTGDEEDQGDAAVSSAMVFQRESVSNIEGYSLTQRRRDKEVFETKTSRHRPVS